MSTLFLIELVGFWGVVFAFLAWEIYKTDQAVKQADAEARAKAEAEAEAEAGAEVRRSDSPAQTG